MFKTLLTAAVFAAALTGGAMAAHGNSELALQSYEYGAVTTPKAVTRPNGGTIVWEAPYKLDRLAPYADDSAMMYSGHTGTLR